MDVLNTYVWLLHSEGNSLVKVSVTGLGALMWV